MFSQLKSKKLINKIKHAKNMYDFRLCNKLLVGYKEYILEPDHRQSTGK